MTHFTFSSLPHLATAGLRFPFNDGEYLPLESEQLHTLRKQFERMMVVIIDEMSLLAADFFYNVHRRMVEIFYCKDMFGDRGVMLVVIFQKY